jgi:hypothetical protein
MELTYRHPYMYIDMENPIPEPDDLIQEPPTTEPQTSTLSLRNFSNIYSSPDKSAAIQQFKSTYANNMRVALNIVKKFRKHRNNVLLYAQMQSGKTITYNLALYVMFQLKMIKRVYILCGMNDNDLKYQALNDAQNHNPIYAHKISVYFNKDLPYLANQIKASPSLLRHTLFVIDESHYGASKGQQLDEFFRRINAPVNRPMPPNLYILSVSATPYAQLMLNLSHNADNTVYLETAPSYIGINDFLTADKFKPIFNPLSMDFVDMVHSYGNKYGLVRALKIENDLKLLCEANGICVVSYDSDGDITTLDELNDILSAEPEQPTIFILKHKLRAGCVIQHKQHIGFVWENAAKPNTDTILQGLVGRMCGYNSNLDVDMYVYPEFMDSELSTAIQSFEELNTSPLKCNHIAKPKVAIYHGTFPTRVFEVDGSNYGFDGEHEPHKRHITAAISHTINTFDLSLEQKEYILHKISMGITRDSITSRAFKSNQYKNEFPMYIESLKTRTPYAGNHGIDEGGISTIVVASVYNGYEYLESKYYGKMFIIFRLPTDAPPPTVSVKSMYHPEDVIPADITHTIFDALKLKINEMIQEHTTTISCNIPFDSPINNQTKELKDLIHTYRPHRITLRFRQGRKPAGAPTSEIRNITISY